MQSQHCKLYLPACLHSCYHSASRFNLLPPPTPQFSNTFPLILPVSQPDRTSRPGEQRMAATPLTLLCLTLFRSTIGRLPIKLFPSPRILTEAAPPSSGPQRTLVGGHDGGTWRRLLVARMEARARGAESRGRMAYVHESICIHASNRLATLPTPAAPDGNLNFVSSPPPTPPFKFVASDVVILDNSAGPRQVGCRPTACLCLD